MLHGLVGRATARQNYLMEGFELWNPLLCLLNFVYYSTIVFLHETINLDVVVRKIPFCANPLLL